ncbi:MAG: hypothetical protein K0S23_376 [Fluviicola sp.]|nr:hypothetical protein [Fluviicola sp.]
MLYSIFAKDHTSVWKQFAAENNGNYIIGKGSHFDRVEISYLNYLIIFDQYIFYQVVGGRSFDTQFTRIRMEFKSRDDLQFRLTHQYLVDIIGKIFGLQDIQIGDKLFDRSFLIKGNDEFKVQTLLSNEVIKEIILAQKDIHLQILKEEGVYDEPIQEGNSMLYFLSKTMVKNIEDLNVLLKLYKEVIDQLSKLGSAQALKHS